MHQHITNKQNYDTTEDLAATAPTLIVDTKATERSHLDYNSDLAPSVSPQRNSSPSVSLAKSQSLSEPSSSPVRSVETVEAPLTEAQKECAAEYLGTNVLIAPNKFIYKSLSCWSLNPCLGCCHGCLFCSVPSTSANKQVHKLAKYGVEDPDAEWGNYLLLRTFDEREFLKSLRRAENTPEAELNPDGNRAVMLCSTTDPYQMIKGPDRQKCKELNDQLRHMVSRSLELIRDHSTINVRILTRSPLARRDFDLMKSFGNRLMFGMSIPSLNDELVKAYEPGAPSVKQRLKALQEAKAKGLNVFVAIAPTFPECDEADLRRTLEAVKELDPVTIYHEPINIRAENIARIENYPRTSGFKPNMEPFRTLERWRRYASDQLFLVERIATELGLEDKLKLWPDADLGSEAQFIAAREAQYQEEAGDNADNDRSARRLREAIYREEFVEYQRWLQKSWDRISAWPGVAK